MGRKILAVGGRRGLAGAATGPAAERALAIERYYDYLDSLLADVIAAIPPKDRLVVLVTQPGRTAPAGAGGRLALSGTGVRLARTTARSTTAAATILYSLGLPVARDLADPPALELFDPELVARHPIQWVETYGSRVIGARDSAGQRLDREMIERMRSLGYVR